MALEWFVVWLLVGIRLNVWSRNLHIWSSIISQMKQTNFWKLIGKVEPNWSIICDLGTESRFTLDRTLDRSNYHLMKGVHCVRKEASRSLLQIVNDSWGCFLGVYHHCWSVVFWKRPHCVSDLEEVPKYTMLGGVIQVHEESNQKRSWYLIDTSILSAIFMTS
jgi:hypothetical protein